MYVTEYIVAYINARVKKTYLATFLLLKKRKRNNSDKNITKSNEIIERMKKTFNIDSLSRDVKIFQ